MYTFIQTIDSILFFFIALSAVYLFVFAFASILKRTDHYPKSKKKVRLAVLIPENATLSELEYSEGKYEIITYNDLAQTINEIGEDSYDVAVILGETTKVSPQILEEINKVYDAGAIAIQLHHIADDHSSRKSRYKVTGEEIGNSIFKQGQTRLGLSSTLDRVDIALDMQWLKKNLRSSKTNLERKLLRQNIFIEYLADVQVHSKDIRNDAFHTKKTKALKFLPEALLTGNWDYCNKIVQCLLPSWQKLFVSTAILALLTLIYNWTISLKWWGILFVLALAIALAMPDYLIGEKKKKKA